MTQSKAITDLLELRLTSAFKGQSFKPGMHSEIYQTIFNCLVEILESSKIEITNEAMNFVAQSFYDTVNVNGGEVLDPNIFTQRAKLENIDTRELAFLAVLFRDTVISFDAIAEIKRRN